MRQISDGLLAEITIIFSPHIAIVGMGCVHLPMPLQSNALPSSRY
jgi:hypothetical protein